MDETRLRELCDSKPSARALFASLEVAQPETQPGAQPETGRTTVEELTGDRGLTRRQAIDLLRELAEVGCGEFKVGRKGHPSRLEWKLDPIELAHRLSRDPRPRAGVETQLDPPLAPPSALALDAKPARPPASTDHGSPTLAADMIEHRYVLRPELRLAVPLPSDLSKREAEVLGDWIRNLSFER